MMKALLRAIWRILWPWARIAELERVQESLLNDRDYWKDLAGDREATATWNKKIGDIQLPHDARETMAKAADVIRAIEDHSGITSN